MKNDVRKGLTNHEVNRSLLGFVGLESIVITLLLTYLLVVGINFNIFASLIISGVIVFGISLSKYYIAVGYLYSLGWGYIGFKLFQWITTATGGGKGLAIIIGSIGFILVFMGTLGARLGGKQYLEDIE